MGKSLGWFDRNQIYEVKNNINAAVYSIAFLDSMPEQHVFPFDVEDTIYFGMSGGKKIKETFDLKNRETGQGVYYSQFGSRIKKHMIHLSNYNPKSEYKYHKFHEQYQPKKNPYKNLYVHVFIPDEKRMPEFIRRCYISAIESDFILQYGYKHGRLPVMNVDEVYDRQRIDPDSVAGQIKLKPKDHNLEAFL